SYAGCFPERPAKVVIIEGLGPPPRSMDEEVRWTVDGFGRIDRALAGHPGLKDLDAAYRRLRERNPRLPEQKARELALLGTRARTARLSGSSTACWRRSPSTARSTWTT